MHIDCPLLSDNQYFKSLNFKLSIAEYQYSRLHAEITTDRWNTSRLENSNPNFLVVLAAYFDGMMHQLHTIQDVLAQLVNNVLNLGENPNRLYLRSLVKEDHAIQKLYAGTHSAIKDLYDATHYLRSYMNYSKHRNLISPYHQYILSTMVCLSTPYINEFTYNGVEYPQKDLLTTAQEEINLTETGLRKVLSCLCTELPPSLG